MFRIEGNTNRAMREYIFGIMPANVRYVRVTELGDSVTMNQYAVLGWSTKKPYLADDGNKAKCRYYLYQFNDGRLTHEPIPCDKPAITEPGKFEGQAPDVPALYAAALEYGAAESFGDVDEYYGYYWRIQDDAGRMRYFVDDVQGFTAEIDAAAWQEAWHDYYGEEEAAKRLARANGEEE